MDGAVYLMSYGWTQGEALRHGGLKRPILVKHKKDQKGLGHNADQQEAWWERVFDGQLKSLDVNTSGGSSSEVSFTQREVKVSGISKNVSPLYRMFRYGGILEGSIKEVKVSIPQKKEEAATTTEPTGLEKKKKKSEKSSSKGSSKDKKKSSRSREKESKKKVKKSGKVGKESSKPKLSKSSEKSKKSSKSKTVDQLEADWVKQIMAQVGGLTAPVLS